MFETIKAVKSVGDFTLEAEFSDGTVKLCSMKPLIQNEENYAPLRDLDLFEQARPVCGGAGIAWNSEIDIASEWIWDHGVKI